ncbi:Dolichyl-phosphate-mannose--protein mannosyltransferase 1, partial [Candida tropicalis]
MGRQLFLHHYQPALYFGILALGHVFDVIVGYLGSRNRALQNFGYFLVLGTSVLSLVFYIYYSPLIYATPWTKDRCLVSKPFKTWDYDCNTFLSQLSEYNNIEASSSSELATPTETVVAQTKGSNKKAAKKEEPHASPAAEVKEEKIIKEEQLAPPLPDEETPKKNDAPQVAEVDSSSNDAEQAEIKEQAKEEAAPVVEEVVAEEPVAEKVEEVKEQVVEKVEEVR